MPLFCPEVHIKKVWKDKFRRFLIHGPTANLTAPLNGRARCRYCGPCEQGCITHSYFNSPITALSAAKATRKLTMINNAVVRRVTMDLGTGLASGALNIDRITRDVRKVRAKAVILCAQSLESVRILFNSANWEHRNGLGNSSGVPGH
jgi:glucoside 3-dehydrogenase (cytochrome c) catalytic subunit